MAAKIAKTIKPSQYPNETSPRKWKTIIIALFAVYALLTTAIFIMHKEIALKQKGIAEHSQATKQQPVKATAKISSKISEGYRADEQKLQLAIRAKPQDAELHSHLAQLHYRHGQTKKAIAEYDKLLQQQPNNPESHLAIAQLYMGQAKGKAKALTHLRQVLQLAPQHPKKRIIELWIKQLAAGNDKK